MCFHSLVVLSVKNTRIRGKNLGWSVLGVRPPEDFNRPHAPSCLFGLLLNAHFFLGQTNLSLVSTTFQETGEVQLFLVMV